MESIHVGYCRDAARSVIRKRGIASPPVDVRHIAAAEGLVVAEADIGSLDARLRQIEGGVWLVELSPNYAETAKRFSIAHELGHLILAHAGCGNNSDHEREANLFAAELLMPLGLLRAALKRTTRLGELAKLFGVSKDAMRIKLDEQHLLLKLTSFD